MEVGPLSRVLMLYASGHEPTQELANAVLGKLDVPLDAMFSTLGRTAARTLETKIIADQMSTWMDKLMANIKAGDLAVHSEEMWDPSTWPKECKGVGFMEAPRWKGHAMEVGPLARVLMLYASGHEPTQELANAVLGQLDVPIDAMFSLLHALQGMTHWPIDVFCQSRAAVLSVVLGVPA